MKLTEVEIRAALGDAINPPRPRPLAPIAYVRHARDLMILQLDAEQAVVKVAKWGWQYKRRAPRPSRPPSTEPMAIQAVLNERLPVDLYVSEVIDLGTHIQLNIELKGAGDNEVSL